MASPLLRLGFRRPQMPSPSATLLLLTSFLLVIFGSSSAPVDSSPNPSEIPVEVQMPADQVIYDQRQNGSENLRVQMSDVTLVLAPAEALFALGPEFIDSSAKPKSQPTPQKTRLSNLLMGFLNKGHH